MQRMLNRKSSRKKKKDSQVRTQVELGNHTFFCCSTGDRLLLPSAVLLQVLSEVDDHNSRTIYLPSPAVHFLLGH